MGRVPSGEDLIRDSFSSFYRFHSNKQQLARLRQSIQDEAPPGEPALRGKAEAQMSAAWLRLCAGLSACPFCKDELYSRPLLSGSPSAPAMEHGVHKECEVARGQAVPQRIYELREHEFLKTSAPLAGQPLIDVPAQRGGWHCSDNREQEARRPGCVACRVGQFCGSALADSAI
eukprot:1144654-Pelagomonas_calceolata.AAC.1